MRKFLASLVVAGAAFAVVAEDPKPAAPAKKAEEKKPEEKKPEAKPAVAKKRAEPTLHVGDAPPALTADQWLQGAEVKSFEKGKIYVVEFWATWCGPCIVMMPHMAEMQHEFKDRGVTFIGYSKKDQNNTLEKVEAFVKRRGPKLGYTFCFGEEKDVYDSWMGAAGQNGIPCCFVVDRETKIAYIGHPMYLDLVLPKVVEGKYSPDDAKAVDAAEKDTDAVFEALSGKPEDALKALANFEKKYPSMDKVPYFVAPRLMNTLKSKKYDDALILAKNLVARGRKTSDESLLGTVTAVLSGPETKGQKGLRDLAVTAADEALALAGEKDLRALMGVAQASFAAGNKSKGKEYAIKTLAVAEERSKANVGMTLSGAAIGAGEKALGIELAEKAIEAGGERMKSGLQAQLAGYFVAAGDKASGAEYAKLAIESAPATGKATIKSTLAVTYLRAGDKKTGDTYAKEAIEGAAEAALPIMYYNLANAYYGIGEKVTAHDYAEKAIEKAPAQLQRQLKPALKKIIDDPDGKTTDK